MALEIPIDVGDDYAIRFSVDLEGLEIGLFFRWHDRISGWLLDVTDADGVLRSAGRRVEAGASLIPDNTWPALPPGRLVAVGSVDLTRREYLGTAVRLLYLTAAEVAG